MNGPAGETCPRERIAAALGVSTAPEPCPDACGEHLAMIVPIRSQSALREARLDLAPFALSPPKASRHEFISIATRRAIPGMISARVSSSTRMGCAKSGHRERGSVPWGIPARASACLRGLTLSSGSSNVRGSSTLTGVVARGDSRRPSRGERRWTRHSCCSRWASLPDIVIEISPSISIIGRASRPNCG